MRHILTTLAIAGLFGSVILSNESRAGCAPTGAACATCPAPKHPPCQASERCLKHFARWDACREKWDEKIDKFFNPTCCQKGAVFAVTPCAVPVYTCPQVVPSGQGY